MPPVLVRLEPDGLTVRGDRPVQVTFLRTEVAEGEAEPGVVWLEADQLPADDDGLVPGSLSESTFVSPWRAETSSGLRRMASR